MYRFDDRAPVGVIISGFDLVFRRINSHEMSPVAGKKNCVTLNERRKFIFILENSAQAVSASGHPVDERPELN